MEKLNIDSIKNKFSVNRHYIKNGKLCEAKNFSSTSLKEYNELKKDTLITIEENRNPYYKGLSTYTKAVRNINSNFRSVKIYNINTLLLKREATYFSYFDYYLNNYGGAKGLEIGISKEYDENGVLIKEIDNDKNYPFPINMLIEKVKTDYNIDLSVYNEEKPILVWRFYENSRWVYCVRIFLSTDLIGPKRFIKLDGVTGEVISDKVVSLSVDTSINTNTKAGKRIEKLDIESIKNSKFAKYRKVIGSSGDHIYLLEYKELINDTLIIINEYEDIYKKTTQKMNSPFSNNKVYYKSNYQLKSEANEFYGFTIGLGRIYEEDGSLIQVRNYEEYPFSIEMLIEKMKNEYNIDLLNIENVILGDAYSGISPSVSYIYTNDFGWIYEVRVAKSFFFRRAIKINGTTGELISDEDNIYTWKK